NLPEHSQPLSAQLRALQAHTRDVPPRVRQAGHESGSDRIAAAGHHDGNTSRCLLSGTDRSRTRSDNHVNFQSCKFGREAGQSIRAIAGSMFDDDVLVFDVAERAETLTQFLEPALRAEEADASHFIALLCPRRQRTCRRTAEQDEETASSHPRLLQKG